MYLFLAVKTFQGACLLVGREQFEIYIWLCTMGPGIKRNYRCCRGQVKRVGRVLDYVSWHMTRYLPATVLQQPLPVNWSQCVARFLHNNNDTGCPTPFFTTACLDVATSPTQSRPIRLRATANPILGPYRT